MSRRISWCEIHESSADESGCYVKDLEFEYGGSSPACQVVPALLLLDGIPEEWVERAAEVLANHDTVLVEDAPEIYLPLARAVLESVLDP